MAIKRYAQLISMAPVFRIQRASKRYFASHGWLQTFFSFSFAEYYDAQNINWGALRVLNDDSIAPHSGFETHPHRDMEIITYVLDGELEHQDSMGHRGVVRSGGVQYMSAGTGILHSEKNAGDTPLHLLQMWVLPRKIGLSPNYGQLDFTVDDRLDKLLLVATGQTQKLESKETAAGLAAAFKPISIHQDAFFFISRLEKKTLTHMFAKGRLGFLFVADGSVNANGEALKAGDAVRMADVEKLELSGKGDVVLWDLPAL